MWVVVLFKSVARRGRGVVWGACPSPRQAAIACFPPESCPFSRTSSDAQWKNSPSPTGIVRSLHLVTSLNFVLGLLGLFVEVAWCDGW